MFNDDQYTNENNNQYYAQGVYGGAYGQGATQETTVASEPRETAAPKLAERKPNQQAKILVVGVGGGGCNAVNHMVSEKIKSAKLVVMNTDVQALSLSAVPFECKIQLGEQSTKGLGAGSDPEIGRKAALESEEAIRNLLQDVDLLFITAGMGGGTGTGAAPVIAEIAHSMKILTVAVVTKPFEFETTRRMKNAEAGIARLREMVDTIVVVPNQKLLDLNPKISVREAFSEANKVLIQAVRSIVDVISEAQIVNLDFADVRTVLANQGDAHLGIGRGEGENMMLDAVREAVYTPLAETDIRDASGLIINFVGGETLSLHDVNDACNMIKDVIAEDANFKFGMATLPGKKDLTITIIATGVGRRTSDKAVNEQIKLAPRRPADVSAVAADSFTSAPNNGYPVRPTFGQSSRPVMPQQPQPQPSRVPLSEGRSDVKPSRVDVPQRNVPHFLRRLRDNDENNNR